MVVVSFVFVSSPEDTFLAKDSRRLTLLIHTCYFFWPDLPLALITNHYSGLTIFSKRANGLKLLIIQEYGIFQNSPSNCYIDTGELFELFDFFLQKGHLFHSTFHCHEDELQVVWFCRTGVIFDKVGSTIGQFNAVFKQMANILTEYIFKSPAKLIYLIDLTFINYGLIDSKLSRIRQVEGRVFDMVFICHLHFVVWEHRSNIYDVPHTTNHYLTRHRIVLWHIRSADTSTTQLVERLEFIIPP